MSNKDITNHCKRYIIQAVMINVLLMLATLALSTIIIIGVGPMGPMLLSGIFGIVTAAAIGLTWRWVAMEHKDSLPQFFTATSGFRMLLALFTLTGCYFCVGDDIKTYVIVFMVYYLVAIGHHAIFFANITNKN